MYIKNVRSPSEKKKKRKVEEVNLFQKAEQSGIKYYKVKDK